MCVYLGSHGDGGAAAADAPSCSRGEGEAGGQVAAVVVRSGDEGSHCHSHFAGEVAEPLTVPLPHLIWFPSGFGVGCWCWAAGRRHGSIGPKVIRPREFPLGWPTAVSCWDHGPDEKDPEKKKTKNYQHRRGRAQDGGGAVRPTGSANRTKKEILLGSIFNPLNCFGSAN